MASNFDSPNVTNISIMNKSLVARSLPAVATSSMAKEELLRHMQAVLQADEVPLHAQDVRKAWSSYLQLVVEPAGWLAVLVPSQDTANMLGLEMGRRGATVVEVRDVFCDTLEAEVEILKPPDNQGGGESICELPVDELYPVKHQEYDSINMTPTVVALDLIRFFYKHIWMPWDNDSDCPDWPSQHLINRVRLHFNLAMGGGDQATALRLDQLAVKAEANRTALQEMEDTAGLGDEDSMGEPPELSYQVVGKLYQLHKEQDSIRREAELLEQEAELLENPLLRLAVTANTVAARREGRESKVPGVLMVWGEGSVRDLGELMSSLGEEFGFDVGIQTFPDLQHAVDVAVAGDTVLVCREGEHKLRGLGALGGGGKILGRARGGKVILLPGDSSNVFIGMESGQLELRDLDLEMIGQCAGVMVRGGELVMENVTMTGGETVVKVGEKGRWQLKDCKLKEGGIGLDLGEGSEGKLVNCVVEGNRVGISVREGAVVTVEGSYVSRNKEHGLVLQCGEGTDEGIWEGEAGVRVAKERGVDLSGSEVEYNGMGDVAVLEEIVGVLNNSAVEKKSHLSRRFSTPLSTASHSDLVGSNSMPNSPIPHTTRVLTFFPGDQGSPN